jgi:hypothetical protein
VKSGWLCGKRRQSSSASSGGSSLSGAFYQDPGAKASFFSTLRLELSVSARASFGHGLSQDSKKGLHPILFGLIPFDILRGDNSLWQKFAS